MTATMIDMELIHIDDIDVWLLEAGDLIEIEQDIVTVKDVIATDDGYTVEHVNDFGEEDSVDVLDDARFKLFIDE